MGDGLSERHGADEGRGPPNADLRDAGDGHRCLVLWKLRDRFTTGALFALYLVLAGTERLLVEFVRRNDEVDRRPDAAAAVLDSDDRRRLHPACHTRTRGASTACMSLRRRALHLFALSSFAVAQPLFSKLGPAPQYFEAHDVSGLGQLAFALALLLLPPLALIAIEAVAGLASRRFAAGLHTAFVGGLVAVIALPVFGPLPTAVAVALAALCGLAAAVAYARWPGARSFATALAFAPALFLRRLPVVARVRIVPAAGRVHPVRRAAELLLETPDRKIDAVRYPEPREAGP